LLPVVVLNSPHARRPRRRQLAVQFHLRDGYRVHARECQRPTADAQAEIAPGEICGSLPKGFDPKTYRTKPWHVSFFIRDGFRIKLGGRTVEVIATPGHTPDAIALLDRDNKLLFTGDTYYPAPIWLFRPETDLDAYEVSVKKLAALAPQLKLVLGAHNVPVAQPAVLPALVQAFADLQGGKATCKPRSGKKLCAVDNFSFFSARPLRSKLATNEVYMFVGCKSPPRRMDAGVRYRVSSRRGAAQSRQKYRAMTAAFS
jgi:hypothetical protein